MLWASISGISNNEAQKPWDRKETGALKHLIANLAGAPRAVAVNRISVFVEEKLLPQQVKRKFKRL